MSTVTGSGRKPGPHPWAEGARTRHTRRGVITFVIVLVAALAATVPFDLVQPAALTTHPTVDAALDTCVLLAALAAAWGLCLNFAASRRRRDLLLASGIVMLAAIELVSLDGPTVLELQSVAAVAGAPLIGSVLAAGFFLAAAFTPPQLEVGSGTHPGAIAVAAGLATAAAVVLSSWLLRGALAPAAAGARAHGVPLAPADPLTVALLVAGAALSAIAASRFLDEREPHASATAPGDAQVAPLFAAAVVLIVIGAACLGWVDPTAPQMGMWLAAFCLVAVGAVRRLAAQRRQAAADVAERDRRQLARDLHDGICQDLAFIVAHGARLAATDGDDHPIVVAARSALATSRGALAELSASDAPSARQALRRVAADLAFRHGITVEVRADDVPLHGDDREAVVRIVREAIVNAATHGDARNVLVTVRDEGDRLVLRVADDGRGLEAAGPRREGFGTASMRERASELGGRLAVRPREGGGTEVELVVS